MKDRTDELEGYNFGDTSLPNEFTVTAAIVSYATAWADAFDLEHIAKKRQLGLDLELAERLAFVVNNNNQSGKPVRENLASRFIRECVEGDLIIKLNQSDPAQVYICELMDFKNIKGEGKFPDKPK